MKRFISLSLIYFLTISSLYAQNQNQVEKEMKALIKNIDNKKIGARLQDREFAIALYQQILGQNPSKEELFTATWLLKDRSKAHGDHICHSVNVPRSQLLALLLARKEKVSELSLKTIEKNLPMLRKLDLKTPPSWQERKHSSTSSKKIPQKLPLAAHKDEYQLYFGYLHAHTSYSDGSGTPEQAYRMARDEGKLDFFAVTDHAELLWLWPWANNWKKIKETAQKFHKDNSFVALHGFEWSSPLFGHINVIHSDKYVSCIEALFIEDIMNWITENPKAIARFNHPGYIDEFSIEFEHYKLYAHAIKQMVGMEMHNGRRGIAKYLASKGPSGKFNHLDDANQKGWKIGAVGGQDNHGEDWGLKNDFLVGVWAKSLTREGILDAYRQRRTYATEDRNMGLSFKMDGAEIGSRLAPGEKNVSITLWDNDREDFSKVSIFKSGTLLKTYEVKGKAPKLGFKLQTKAKEYYYVLVTQADGDLALSSPIWIGE